MREDRRLRPRYVILCTVRLTCVLFGTFLRESKKCLETLAIREAEPGGTSSLFANNATKILADLAHNIGRFLRSSKFFPK